MSWTDFEVTANDSTAIDAAIIAGTTVITRTFGFDAYIGQHNNGQHAALFGDVQSTLADAVFPAPIVDATGLFRAGRRSTSSAPTRPAIPSPATA